MSGARVSRPTLFVLGIRRKAELREQPFAEDLRRVRQRPAARRQQPVDVLAGHAQREGCHQFSFGQKILDQRQPSDRDTHAFGRGRDRELDRVEARSMLGVDVCDVEAGGAGGTEPFRPTLRTARDEQQRIAREIGGIGQSLCVRNQRRRADRKHLFVHKRLGRELRPRGRRRADANRQVGLEHLEVRRKAGITNGCDFHVDAGMSQVEFAQAGHQPAAGKARKAVDAHALRAARADAAGALGDEVEGLGDAALKLPPGLGLDQPLRGADEKLRTHMVFEQTNLVADGGRRDVQLGRRILNASGTANGFEHAQRGQRRQPSHSRPPRSSAGPVPAGWCLFATPVLPENNPAVSWS